MNFKDNFMTKLKDKIAIITGGAGGIGRVTAEFFLNEGADVLIFDNNKADLENTIKEINSKKLSHFIGDVTILEDNLKAVNLAKEKFGGLDIFVANAGTEGEVNNIEDYDLEIFDKVIDINIKGVFLGLKASIPAMSERGGGSYIISSSVAAVSYTHLTLPTILLV